MSVEHSHSFVAWEEQIVCSDRGRRLVHFYMRKASGESMLSVIGTERSIRHMLYVGTDELLQTCGTHRLIKASLKWRARREVVDLLNSLVSDSRMENSVECLASSEQLAPRKLRSSDEEIKWSGDAWFCAKQLKHYSAFCRSNVTVTVNSFVFIMAELDEQEEGHYLGYLEDMHEDKKGLKKVRVRWFHLPQEIVPMFPWFNPHPREAFITPQVQVISADCVEGPATVLTPKHYEAFSAAPLQVAPPSKILMCSQQLENNNIRPFSLFKLHGYCNQEIVSLLDPTLGSMSKIEGGNGNEGNDKEVVHVNCALPGGPRSQVLKPVRPVLKPVSPELRLKISKGVVGMKIGRSEHRASSLVRINEMIELFCQDSGIRGCWFRCRVLMISVKNLKVRYEDIMDIDDSAKLEEWVPTSRVANPDKLEMRCSGRKTIRPWPPRGDIGHCTFKIGSAVDAWWCGGWWEGVVIGCISKPDKVQVYLPGEDKILTLERRCLRNSRDWIDNRWVDIKPKPDVVSFLSSNGFQIPKLSMCSNTVEELPGPKDNRISIPDTVEQVKEEAASSQ